MKKTILLLSIIIFVYALLYWLRLNYVLTMDNLNVMYGEVVNGSSDVASKIYNQMHSFWFIGMAVTVLTVSFKVFFWALVVYVGFYLVSKQEFLLILNAVVVTEFVNVMANIIKNIDLIFFNPPTSMADISIAPLSLASFFDADKLDQWMLVPLSAVNVFEILYILLLSFVLSRNLKTSFGPSCKVVVCSYGLATLIITVVSTFLAVYVTH